MKKIMSLILAGLFVVSLIIPSAVLFASEEEDMREIQMQEEEEANPGYEMEDENQLKDEAMDDEKGSGEEEQDPSDEKEQVDEK